MSAQTRTNWLIDATAFLGVFLAALSGISFLFLPSGDDLRGLHTFGSGLTIVACTVHLARHWQWVKTMTGRCVNALLSRQVSLSRGARLSIVINIVVALSFLIAVISGFLLHQRSDSSGEWDEGPLGGFRGGRPGNFLGGRPANRDVASVFQWVTLDLIHLWAAGTLIGAVAVHLWSHWRWVTNVTRQFLGRWNSNPIG